MTNRTLAYKGPKPPCDVGGRDVLIALQSMCERRAVSVLALDDRQRLVGISPAAMQSESLREVKVLRGRLSTRL